LRIDVKSALHDTGRSGRNAPAFFHAAAADLKVHSRTAIGRVAGSDLGDFNSQNTMWQVQITQRLRQQFFRAWQMSIQSGSA
jgi:hypothetical protein